MPVDATASPLVVHRIHGDIRDRIAMLQVLRLVDHLARAHIVDIARAVLGAADEIPIAIRDLEADGHSPVEMSTREVSHGRTHSQVPKLDAVVCAPSQKGVVGLGIPIASFVELERVKMPLVAVLEGGHWLVGVGIVDYELFVAAAQEPEVALKSVVVEAEAWDVLGCGVGEGLQEFVESSLL